MKFAIGNKVFMKITTYRHVMRFGRKSKLALRLVGPYEILEHIGKVTYKLALLVSIDKKYNVFYVLLLHKHIRDPTQVLKVKDVKLRNDLVYEERPV